MRAELDQLVSTDVLENFTNPSDWVSSMVVEKKRNGKMRLCIAPTFLNRALKRSHYRLPVLEDILPRLSKAKVFTVVDARNGF